MAGHSKWANIQHRKKAQDNKRGKVFTKLIREITVAAKMGGEDSQANPRLRLAIDKALAQNMTRDTIDRAIKRGAGGQDTSNFVTIRYEGYAAGGVAVLVDCLTDNRNRSVSEVRHAFSKCGGQLAVEGSVSYLFHEAGTITLAPGFDENTVMEIAIEHEANDVITQQDGSIEIITSSAGFHPLITALEKNNIKPAQAEISMIAANQAALDATTTDKLTKLYTMLEALDDVQNIYCNAADFLTAEVDN